MKIYPVTDPAFKPYGRVAEGYPVAGILAGLAQTPLTDAVAYVGTASSTSARRISFCCWLSRTSWWTVSWTRRR